MKANLNKFICSLTVYYPVVYTFLVLFSDSLARNLAQLYIVVLFFALLLTRKKSNLVMLGLIVIITLINAFRFGYYYVLHQDYYSFIMLLSIFSFFADEKNIALVTKEFDKQQKIEIIIYSYFAILLLSILFKGGLSMSNDWGVTMPMLYGPFSLPHSTAYQLLLIYAMASILYHKFRKKKYIILMLFAFALLMWTGVRSAFLAIGIMAILDFQSIRKLNFKIVIIMLIFAVLLYLVLFTDILINNPIIQKTIFAAGRKSGITNSRIDFNNYLFQIFISHTTIGEKIFGIGMDNLRHYMYLRYGTELHAHNDIFNSLLGMGLIGLFIYVRQLLQFVKKSIKWIPAVAVLFILLFTNGLYMYMPFTPSVVIILIFTNYIYNNEGLNNVTSRRQSNDNYTHI